MKKRRVLFLIESLAGGGAEKVLTTLVQHIDKERFDVTVCAISGGGKYEDAIKRQVSYKAILAEPKNGNVWERWLYVLKHHLVYKWLPLSWVYRVFVPQNSDVEVAFVEGFTTKLLSYSTNLVAKRYAWVHIDLHQNHWTKSVYDNLKEETDVYNQYTELFGVSNTVVSAFRKEFPNVTVPVETVYNPIDVHDILSRANEIVDLKCGKSLLMVTVGRLEPQKSYMRLLRIAKKLIEDGMDVELWILGDGTERNLLEQYVSENKMQERVCLLGFHTNPYKYLRQGDLFVCSSLSEGYSTAVTEALILGLPIITTDCSGMAELLQNGECGVITENDEAALYEGLKRLLADKSLLEHYRHKAIERGKEFSIEHLMKPIETILMA
ncbi:MAG: glycosyltransferase [Bacteroidaceae bacterium]|nr:glycosyltransferase [Bacteroidaceae bacterium]